MLILLLSMVSLSSAFINDLNTILGHIGCTPTNPLPLNGLDPANTVATELSKYCNSYQEIVDCIEQNANETSLDPVVWNFAKKFDKNTIIMQSQDICTQIQDAAIGGDLQCLQTAVTTSCLADWIQEVDGISSSHSYFSDEYFPLCSASFNLKNCVQNSLILQCTSATAEFMGKYTSVLLSDCSAESTVASNSDSFFGMSADSFNLEGSAIMQCSSSFVEQMMGLINSTFSNNMANPMSLVDDAFDIFCGQRNTLVTCLTDNMPNSASALDQIALLFVDLDGVGTALDNYCDNQDVISDNMACMSSEAVMTALMPCIDVFNFSSSVANQGFAMFDYMCSAVVNMTECYGQVAKSHCSNELGNLMTSTTEALLTPQCQNAKPRPVVGVMQPGWSYNIIPGGMVAMECVLPTASELITLFNNTGEGNGEDSNAAMQIVSDVVEHVCLRADSILTCLETNLPGADSVIDRLTRDVIGLQKLRGIVESFCPKKEEFVELFPCFINESNQPAQAECFTEMSEKFLQAMGTLNPLSLLVPATADNLKGFLCGESSGYKQWVTCEANAIKGCSSKLADDVTEFMTGALKDTCLTGQSGNGQNGNGNGEGDDCVGSKCGASSIIVHSLLWLLVGAVTLRFF